MKRSVCILILAMLMASLSGCAQAPAPTPIPSTAAVSTPCPGLTITLGEISDDPDEVTQSMQPLADYLANKLAPFGYACGDVKVVDTVDQMIALMNKQEVDIYMDSVYPAALISQATGALPILLRYRFQTKEYYTVLFTIEGSGITSVDDLRGHMVAMDQVFSTSGFVLPAVYLMDHGLNLALKDSYTEQVAPDEVGIFFSLDDKNTLNYVLEGKASAGATDDYRYGKWIEEAKKAQSPINFFNLGQTSPVPRQVVVVRPGMEIALMDAIKIVLLEAPDDTVGKEALKQAEDSIFDDKLAEILAVFTQMLKMHDRLGAIPGWQAAFNKGISKDY